MPAINTGTHPILLWPGIHATWGQEYASHPTQYTDLYDVRDSDKAYEKTVEITGFSMAPIKPEGDSMTYDVESQGVVTTAVHIPYALGYIVTYEERRDNLYSEVASRRARANAFAIAQTIENIGAFPYNNAFATTYFTSGDGQALCSASHVQPMGGTFSNVLTPAAALSEAALEDISIQIMGAQNSRGGQINVMPKSLHVSRHEFYNAERILKSTLQPDSTSNNINVLKATGMFPGGAKVNQYFTSAHAWFVRTNVPEGMVFFWRDRPMFDQDNDFDTKNAKAGTYFRCSVTCGDPRSLYGSNAP